VAVSRRAVRTAVALAVGVLLLAGCQSGGGGAGSADAPGGGTRLAGTQAPTATVAPRALVTTYPGDGASRVRPDTPLSVTVDHGSLAAVTVTDAEGSRVPGRLAADERGWAAIAPLRPNAAYTVRTRAVNGAGASTRSVSRFTTLATERALTTSISPLDGQTVGVGMPLVVRLSEPVTDRAAVQAALRVSTSRKAPGSWSWISDSELQYRPRRFWPARTDIALAVALTGVHAGGSVWGDETRTIRVRTGAAMISVVDVEAKRMTVRRDGRVLRRVPVTTGKAGFLTRGGIKVVSEKHRIKVMDAATGGTSRADPEYYRLEVEYAVRVTWSGEFLHAAPWSEGQQGSVNVSHGCVGMSMADGRWFYENTNVGDIVKVVNSPRRPEPGNGYTAWNVPWSRWVAGSAV